MKEKDTTRKILNHWKANLNNKENFHLQRQINIKIKKSEGPFFQKAFPNELRFVKKTFLTSFHL